MQNVQRLESVRIKAFWSNHSVLSLQRLVNGRLYLSIYSKEIRLRISDKTIIFLIKQKLTKMVLSFKRTRGIKGTIQLRFGQNTTLEVTKLTPWEIPLARLFFDSNISDCRPFYHR